MTVACILFINDYLGGDHMEQALVKTGRHAGWSDAESNLLWETADEAQQQGLPLKSVFERIAEKTGRRPNSIRNYYYAQVRRQKGDEPLPQRFVPFTEEEVDWLMTEVFKARSQGSSVRACLQRLSGGDHGLTLRYQNKYRAVLKTRPEYVKKLVERLRAEGVDCSAPEVNRRVRQSAEEAGCRLNESAYRSGDAELVRACETLTALIDASRREERFCAPQLVNAVKGFVRPLKNFLSMDDEGRRREMNDFAREMTGLIGQLEAQLPAGAV